MGHLSIFESKFSRLKEDRDNVMRAKEALELQEPGMIHFNVIERISSIYIIKINLLVTVNNLIL